MKLTELEKKILSEALADYKSKHVGPRPDEKAAEIGSSISSLKSKIKKAQSAPGADRVANT